METKIEPEMRIRYEGTGTSGIVSRLEDLGGVLFAEIDTTGLLYRVNELTGISISEKNERDVSSGGIDFDRDIFKGREFQEALNLDNSCEGGG